MKTIICIAAVSMALGASVEAATPIKTKKATPVADRDEWCLGQAQIAVSAAGLYAMGQPLEKAIEDVSKSFKNADDAAYTYAIMRFVYYMQLSEKDAAKMVYLKCTAGSFGGSRFN